MRIFLKMFEGTPEEFKTVAPFFEDTAVSVKEKSFNEDMNGENRVEPVEALRCMFSRREIPEIQLSIYKALHNGKVEYTEFCDQIERTPGQIAGIFGALGRRISNTAEVRQSELLGKAKDVIKWERDRDNMDKWYISLTPNALEALKAEGVV